jgi:hypothetical protein
MRPRKNTAKQKRSELQDAEDQNDIRQAGVQDDYESRYIAWHKANHSEAEHAKFLEEGIIPSPKN